MPVSVAHPSRSTNSSIGTINDSIVGSGVGGGVLYSTTTNPPTQMNIDMTLATSYKPILICIAKVCALMVFHYASAPMFFITERYAMIVAVMYIDKWLAHEYIINTNSCNAVLTGSLLVHELRDAGVQERLHGEFTHNLILCFLFLSNISILVMGEHQTMLHLLFASNQGTNTTSSDPILDTSIKDFDTNNKGLRPQANTNNICGVSFNPNANPNTPSNTLSNTHTSVGPLMCVLSTSLLLVLLSTCAMPVSAHDSVLNNLRVWSFTILSLSWMYTVNYKDLRYSTVVPFTPCLLRFSCILFLTPTPIAIAGIFIMSACLAATHTWLNKHRPPQYETFSSDYVHQGVYPSVHQGIQQGYVNDTVAVVVRDTKPNSSPSSGMSYRAPSATPSKPEVFAMGSNTVSNMGSNMVSNLGSNLGSNMGTNMGTKGTTPNQGFALGSALDPALIRDAPENPNKNSDKLDNAVNHGNENVDMPIPDSSIDYDSMFLQALSERES